MIQHSKRIVKHRWHVWSVTPYPFAEVQTADPVDGGNSEGVCQHLLLVVVAGQWPDYRGVNNISRKITTQYRESLMLSHLRIFQGLLQGRKERKIIAASICVFNQEKAPSLNIVETTAKYRCYLLTLSWSWSWPRRRRCWGLLGRRKTTFCSLGAPGLKSRKILIPCLIEPKLSWVREILDLLLKPFVHAQFQSAPSNLTRHSPIVAVLGSLVVNTTLAEGAELSGPWGASSGTLAKNVSS